MPNRGGNPRRSLAALVGTAAEGLFATLFPGNCRFCDAPLARISRVPVCDICLEAIRAIPAEQRICSVCGERLLRPADLQGMDGKCAACRTLMPPFVMAVAYGEFDGALRELIHLLKYDLVRPAASVLGRMAGEVVVGLSTKFGPVAPLVIPVPLHRSKLRARGFNQSELIARAAVKTSRLGLHLNVSALRRLRPTESQTGLSRAERQKNIRGAFGVIHSEEVSGRDILLVDDVFTTGTTVSECGRVLRIAGAERIFVATVARVLLPVPTGADPEQVFQNREIARAAHA